MAHRKPRGSTHCHRDSKIGRFFAAYLRPDGTVLCRSPTVLIGPKVQIKAEVKANLVHVRYRIESEQKSVRSKGIGPNSYVLLFQQYVVLNISFIELGLDRHLSFNSRRAVH